jgi:hypothetical protein
MKSMCPVEPRLRKDPFGISITTSTSGGSSNVSPTGNRIGIASITQLAYATKLIGNQSEPVDANAQGNLQKLHPDLVICHACVVASLRPWIVESIVSLDLTLARCARSKSLFLRIGADLASLHFSLLFDLARLWAQRVRTLGRWTMMRTAVLTLLAALALVATPTGHTAVIPFHLTLIGANENPPVASPGTGTADIELDTDLRTLSLDVTFADLLGTTTAAHIHCCTPPTGNAGVATQVPTFIDFPLGVTSGTYSRVFDMTLASFYNPAFIADHGGTVDGAFDFLVAGMLTGQTYLNIHSTAFPGGEIRDTLIPIAEPASLALLGIALASLAAIRRRQQ